MKRRGKVYFRNMFAGKIEQTNGEYKFTYDTAYLAQPTARPISLTMPLQKEPFISLTMLPFFDGLIPEGWLLNIAAKSFKVDPRDRMRLLLELCSDCIGAVHVIQDENDEHEN